MHYKSHQTINFVLIRLTFNFESIRFGVYSSLFSIINENVKHKIEFVCNITLYFQLVL